MYVCVYIYIYVDSIIIIGITIILWYAMARQGAPEVRPGEALSEREGGAACPIHISISIYTYVCITVITVIMIMIVLMVLLIMNIIHKQ